MERYSRHIIMKEIGMEGQARIRQSRVLVIGAGGLGCPVLQYLAAAGVGKLGIVDFDVVEESNLQRQVLFGNASLGQNKARAARHRLTDLNPEVQVHTYPIALHRDNALELFDDYDIIVDGTDSIPTRYLINDAALLCDKPVVYGAVYKFEGQLAVFNYQGGPTYRCLFPQPPNEEAVANCSEVGVLGVLPGIIGSMQANEVLKIILRKAGILSGKLLCYDSRSGQTALVSLPNTSAELRARLRKEGRLPDHTPAPCASQKREISAEAALALEDVLFVDVRDAGEVPQIDLPNCVHIPLPKLIQQPEQLPGNGPCVFFCASGIRSQIAVSRLGTRLKRELYNLRAGALTLQHHLK